MGGVRPVLKGTIEEIRKSYDDLLAMIAPQMPKLSDAVSTKDGEVDGIKYRVCTPVEASKSGALPIDVYTHGGGMIVGNLGGEDICMKISFVEAMSS
jgi:versiconal hemiacetal acetate esterase